jgi:hypothetical protein
MQKNEHTNASKRRIANRNSQSIGTALIPKENWTTRTHILKPQASPLQTFNDEEETERRTLSMPYLEQFLLQLHHS